MTPADKYDLGRSATGLVGVRVLELGQMVSAPYATKLLADLGAEVIKVEPPEGDRARHRGPFREGPTPDGSGLFLSLNTNKSSIVVDGIDDYERLLPLLDVADILVTNYGRVELGQLGINLEDLAEQRPDLVICSITPFGRTGPHAEYQAEELTVSHAGGWAYQCPGATDESSKPPLKVFGHQTDFHAGVAAAMVSLAAFDRAERTGLGELIDLSTVAHTAGMLEAALIAASYMGENPSRLGSRLLNPWGIFPCRNGLIFLVTVEQDQWERLVSLMGSPEWAESGLFDTTELRLENEDLLRVYLEEWTSKHDVEELWHLGQSERICFAPVLSMSDMATQAHLEERQFIVEVDHPATGTVKHLGPPFKASNGMWGPLKAAPTLDPNANATFGPPRATTNTSPSSSPSPTEGQGSAARPLEGLRVLDLSWVWAGPYAGLHLAFLGAEVVKVESSLRPGLGRRLPLHPTDLEPTLNTSAYFNQWEQAKLSCELDLSDPDSIAIVKELAGICDVVIENFATGVMERLGLGYEELRAVNPNIIVASISGYGSEGPLREYIGYGPTTGPLSGLTSLTGYPDGPPEELGISFGDPAAGMMAAFAICAAVVSGRASDEGVYLDIALWEATASNAVEGWMAHALAGRTPERMGNRDPLMSPHGCYPTAAEPDDGPDELEVGRWISIACANDLQWRMLAALIDPALPTDARFQRAEDRKSNEEELDTIITQWTAQRDRWKLTEQLQAIGVAAFPSMSPQDLLADPHLWERGFLERLEHPEVGKQIHAGVPWLLKNAPNGVSAPAPLLGQHTHDVLRLVGRTTTPT